jgi:flavorubredoxin
VRATRVTDGIHWVGAIDWNLRDFHGYETPNGATYNAYLVVGDDKIALVDTVKAAFIPELFERIESVVPLSKIDYIVVNHIEPDHNGGLRLAMEAMPQAKVVASAGGVRGIAEYHGPDLEISPVGADDVLDLGGKTLRFIPMPMVHWPDSMFTFCPEVCTLMCNDAFGQHLATSERFVDEIDLDLAIEELATYYANILMPLASQVSKSVAKVIELGWTCNIVAPSHGLIWRGESLSAAFAAYDRWTSGETKDKLVIAYSTMWGSTDVLAREIADGVRESGVDVHLFDLAESSLSLITRHLLDSRALLLGSPALHHGMLYRVAAYLQYIAGLKPKDKLAGVFGSYGWSSGATKQMRGRLEELGFEIPLPDFTVKFKPLPDDIAGARAYGREMGELVKAKGVPSSD